MMEHKGVSTNNTDKPPSLYEPSVNFSNSLLEVTSISRNIPALKTQNPIQKDKGRGITTFLDYKNTKFM